MYFLFFTIVRMSIYSNRMLECGIPLHSFNSFVFKIDMNLDICERSQNPPDFELVWYPEHVEKKFPEFSFGETKPQRIFCRPGPVYNGTETRGTKTWQMVPNEIKSSHSLYKFKTKIKLWKPQNCACGFCSAYLRTFYKTLPI